MFILKKEHNSAYHELISSFRAKTGLGVVLNTSFNLHGEPLVDSPEDALDTFARSNLDAVFVEGGRP